MSRQLVNEAKSGNINALKDLGSAILNSKNSILLTILLPIILEHLEKNSPGLKADATPEILRTYLPILGDVLDASTEWNVSSPQASRISSLIDEKWEAVRRWLLFILEDLMESKTPLGEAAGFVDLERLYEFSVFFLFSFSSHTMVVDQPKILRLISRGRLAGFLDLTTRIWLHGARANYPMLYKMSWPFRSIAPRIVHHIDPTPFSNVMLQNPDSVSVCLDNIFKSARRKKFGTVYTSLYVLKLSLEWSEYDVQGKRVEGGPLVDLRRRFIAHQSIVVVTYVLEKITSHPEFFNNKDWPKDESAILIFHCILYISGCLRGDGASFIVLALQNHLLRTTEKAWRMIDDFANDPGAIKEFKTGFGELFEAVTMQLHRADVLRECRKWHRSASNPSKSNDVVSREWKNLHSTVGRRLEQRSQYKRIVRETCNNSKCSALGVAFVDLKRCADCRLAHYCSFECQRAYWPEHRKVCSSSSSNDTFSLAARHLDKDFAKWLVVQDFEYLKDNIRASIEAANIGPDTPSSCIFYYENFPPETEVHPGKMVDDAVPKGTLLEQKTKNDLLIRALFHEGGEERYDITEWVTFTSLQLPVVEEVD